MNSEEFAGLIFLGSLIIIAVNCLISWEFYRVAAMKGHARIKYFWYCFLFGFIGYLLVTALPDRSVGGDMNQVKNSNTDSGRDSKNTDPDKGSKNTDSGRDSKNADPDKGSIKTDSGMDDSAADLNTDPNTETDTDSNTDIITDDELPDL